MRTRERGFTLIEIMITVSIIALLASIAIPNLLRARVAANDSSATAALKTISNALETYSTANNQYPSDINSLTTAVPPYMTVNYFSGTHAGYTFTTTLLNDNTYTITAFPNGALGSGSITISTGGVFTSD